MSDPATKPTTAYVREPVPEGGKCGRTACNATATSGPHVFSGKRYCEDCRLAINRANNQKLVPKLGEDGDAELRPLEPGGFLRDFQRFASGVPFAGDAEVATVVNTRGLDRTRERYPDGPLWDVTVKVVGRPREVEVVRVYSPDEGKAKTNAMMFTTLRFNGAGVSYDLVVVPEDGR